MNQLLEAMMAMSRKEDNPQVSSFHVPEVNNHEFGLPQGYTAPEGVASPSPIRIHVVNLVAQDRYDASIRHGSLYDEEDPINAYFMPPQMMPVVGTLLDPAIKTLCTLEEKFKAM